VCNNIRKKIYPQALLEAFPDHTDFEGIKSWFAHAAFMGEVNARRAAAFYALLTEATVKSVDEKVAKQKGTSPKNIHHSKNSEVKTVPQAISHETASLNLSPNIPSSTATGHKKEPNLHIDLQIHISPEASLEQIDAIFASMAKHLYR